MIRHVIASAALALTALLPADNGQPAARWVAFGDSITEGYGASAPDASYVARIERYLSADIDNRAVGGTRIAEQVDAIEAYDGAATSVLWLTGYNDMRAGTPIDAIARELDSGLDILEARGSRVYLGACLPMTADGYGLYAPKWGNGSDAAVDDITAAMLAVANEHPGVVVVDWSGYDPATLTNPDGVHPNDAGHAEIARAFEGVIRWPVFVAFVAVP